MGTTGRELEEGSKAPTAAKWTRVSIRRSRAIGAGSAAPTHLFWLLATKIQQRDFRGARLRAEEAARLQARQRGVEEVTLAEIYAFIAKHTKVSGDRTDAWMQAEIELEGRICVARPFTKDLYETVRAQGKQIAFTSDTYLPTDAVRSLLERNGYGDFQLFVSSETLKTKASGNTILDQPFFSTKETGLGLGLSISRQIVERHNGELSVRNRPHGGAEYTIHLPRAATSEAAKEWRAAAPLAALAGRAKNVAPVLAQRIDLADARVLLDVGGGTGIYSIALLERNPNLRAIVLDRPEVLRTAREFVQQYNVADRISLHAADMFTDELPPADVVLLSNVLHDWDEPDCQTLVTRCAEILPSDGRLLIHDVLLSDALDGPLPVALYSAALFTLTEGRAYSGLEYRTWLETAGLTLQQHIETMIHCWVLSGSRPR